MPLGLPGADAALDSSPSRIASADPYGHFRPTFYLWLWSLNMLGWSSPRALGLAGLVIQVATAGLSFALLRTWLSARASAIGAAISIMHPVKQDLWFWGAAQIDALCLLFVLASLLAAALGPADPRGHRSGW